MKQEKRGDIERSPEDDLLWEGTYGSLDAFLEAAASTYPRPPGDTWHGLHALLALRSWKHRHAITLDPLNHNPQRWTLEDDATATITIQQDPGNPAGYHPTWSHPTPPSPTSPTLHHIFATIGAGLQEAKAPQQPEDQMPQPPPLPTTLEHLHKEPLTDSITRMEPPPQHRTTPDQNGRLDLPREWTVHNGTIRWDEITPGLQAICLHLTTEPTYAWALSADRHNPPLTVQKDATITPEEATA